MISITWAPSKYKMGLILVNEEPWREVPVTFLKKSPFKASYSTLEEWQSVWNAWERQASKQIAYDKLSRKSYLTDELKKILLTFGFSISIIEELIQNLKSLGYLSDNDYKERLIQLSIKKKKSPLWIKQRLIKGNLSLEEEDYPQSLRKEMIRELMLKYQKKGEKVIGIIARKGFSFEEVIQVYKNLIKDG